MQTLRSILRWYFRARRTCLRRPGRGDGRGHAKFRVYRPDRCHVCCIRDLASPSVCCRFRPGMVVDPEGVAIIEGLGDRGHMVLLLSCLFEVSSNTLRHNLSNTSMQFLFLSRVAAGLAGNVSFGRRPRQQANAALQEPTLRFPAMLEGKLFTPPLSSGVLPGVFRRHLLEMDATSEERVLHLQDLESADGIFLCNAVRGMRQVKSLCLDTSFRRAAVAL